MPLAFSHMVHQDVGIFEIFLSLSFYPSNSHCVYIDAKADKKVFDAVNGIVNCYNEVILKVSNLHICCNLECKLVQNTSYGHDITVSCVLSKSSFFSRLS